jgi:hypothetical protein
MFLASLVIAIIPLAMGVVLGVIAIRAISAGSVKPFRMQRWDEPDEIERATSPAGFWFWILAYLAFSAGALIFGVLALLGKIKLQ